MIFALVSGGPTPTNARLANVLSGEGWCEMTPQQALELLQPGDVALGRLDVLPTVDGIEDGLWALGALAARGIVVLNDAPALLATHDKLLTARLLRRSAIRHPKTTHLREGRDAHRFQGPVVLKPRFGSWGKEVRRCDDAESFANALAQVKARPWYDRHGVLVQELVPPRGYDLRLVVAGGRVVGGVNRIAAEGEWRTNVALGAVRRPLESTPRDAASLALAAAGATGASLVGVDLVEDGHGNWLVLELNGAVEFTPEYAPFSDIYAEITLALEHEAEERGGRRRVVGSPAPPDPVAPH